MPVTVRPENSLEGQAIKGTQAENVLETMLDSSESNRSQDLSNSSIFRSLLRIDKECYSPSHWDLDSDWHLKWWSPYGLSSFTYATLGILMMSSFSGNYDRDPAIAIPINFQASCLVFQTLATQLADVMSIGRRSFWHAFDRFIATINTVMLVPNLIWISNIERAMLLATLCGGLTLLLLSRHERMQPKGRIEVFTLYHALWHVGFPFGLLLWLLYREGYEQAAWICFILFGCQTANYIHHILFRYAKLLPMQSDKYQGHVD